MIKLHDTGVVLRNGAPVKEAIFSNEGRGKTIAYRIIEKHNLSGDSCALRLKFDSLISHDITYVGIIQSAKASGLREFPVPYVLTNCHNSLCAVGGTINEDDHVFGLSAAKRFGGVYVPANMAVIHQYAREMMAGCGKMILGSDSHTRYGALGTMGIGEGGPEIVKQLLGDTYDAPAPEVVLVYLTGKPAHGVGPHDVAIAICGAVYKSGFVKNKILEFVGPAISGLPMDYRIGIDVMTTETACLSSVWETDEAVRDYLEAHGRGEEFEELKALEGAYYDSMIEIDLSTLEPMAALPFHPSEAYTVRELMAEPGDIFREAEKRAEDKFGKGVKLDLISKVRNGKIMIDQGVIAGCAGGMYDNIAAAASIMRGGSVGNGYFNLSVYPSSVPVNMELTKDGVLNELMALGAVIKPCFCGPCFGAGDVPANNGLSIRHTTRNFPNREGSKPGDGQLSAVMLMDARTIAATARNSGVLTSAADIEYTEPPVRPVKFDRSAYDARVYFGFGKANPREKLRLGPNITEWPEIPAMKENMLLRLASVIHDPVTTTDELIPSGETSSLRSNPIKLASYALSRRDPEYVGRTKKISALQRGLESGKLSDEVRGVLRKAGADESGSGLYIGSCIFANRPGDGSAREQAASCQKVLGGCANICYEFATKRYRSNCVNWGILPFTLDPAVSFDYLPGDWIYIPGIRTAVADGAAGVDAAVITDSGVRSIRLNLAGLNDEERDILLKGCLMNWYAARNAGK